MIRYPRCYGETRPKAAPADADASTTCNGKRAKLVSVASPAETAPRWQEPAHAARPVNRIEVDDRTAHYARVALDQMLALPGAGAGAQMAR